MNTFACTCPNCDQRVDLEVGSQVRNLKFSDNGSGAFDFTCPKCQQGVTREVGPLAVEHLLACGVEPSTR
jgi:hypothetical protein